MIGVRDSFLDNWYVIQAQDHDGERWNSTLKPEGTRDEMLAIAKAIETRGEATFSWCAVAFNYDEIMQGYGFAFRCPAASHLVGQTTVGEADELARQIRDLIESESVTIEEVDVAKLTPAEQG